MSATLKNAIRAVNRTALMLGSISTLAISSAALAQEEGALMEEIEVTGIRGSLKQAMDTKRFSNAVVDAVSAEDVGKFPDSDVGEALGRIPGVSVGRQFGQGSSISIRGASAQLTNTLLNGHTVASTGWYDQQAIDRSFNYSLMPAEMVGGIEVYKSSQADLPEGGVGGTVIVKSRKPLDMDANSVFLSAKGDYGTISESVDPEVSGLYSWKNDSETFGILVAGSYSETDYQRNGIESLVGWGTIVPSTFQQDREREAFNLAAQFAPTDALTFGLNYMLLSLDANNYNTSLFVFPENGTCTSENSFGTCTSYTQGADTGFGWAQTWARQASMESETIDLDFEFEGNGYTIDGRIGNTEAEGGTDLTSNYGMSIGNPEDYAGTYDMTGSQIKINTAKKSFTAADFNGDVASASWATRTQPNTDEEFFVQGNVEFETDLGAITSIKTGFAYADHEVEKDNLKALHANGTAGYDASTFFSGQVSSGAGYKLPEPKGGTMLSNAKSEITGWEQDRSGYGLIEEENLSFYVMANFEAEAVRGNFGFRYIESDLSTDFYALDATGAYATTKTTNKADYSDVLPSANLAFDLSDDVILRMSASQVISRPNYDDLFANSALDGFNDGTPGNEVLNIGNVALTPFKATQADLGVEWYYADSSMLSATYFIKDISNFTTTNLTNDQSIGIIDPNSGVDNWTVAQREDGTGGEIEGLELQWQHAWDSGFGVATNYTYADSSAPRENFSDRLAVFSDSSKHTINTVGYWENDVFSARAAYSWRSEYMIREGAGFYGNRMHEDFGSLDLSFGWNITDNLALSLEAVNVLEEDSIQTGEATRYDNEVKAELQDGYPAWSFEGEARYKLGVAYSF